MSAPSPYDHDHENEIIPFGVTNFRGEQRRFGIKTDDRRRHVYVIGKTGMGKTTLLENFVLADINAGHGVAYIDPHGDTADKILNYIPPHRLNDVVYFNPADMDFPVGFNILEVRNDNQKHLVASGLMGVFKKIWPDVWSARMEYILLNCVLALLDTPGSTLLGISRILAEKDFRRKIVENVKDPIVKSFWVNEFAKYTEKFASEAIAPVQNKVGQFLSNTIIRNIVAQPQSTIDVRKIMDERKIFIVNLSKGLVGEDSSKLLGGMLITRLQLAAMERVDMLEKDRQDFYLYVDEFQNFATESFANILSEARKYRLALITAHQYIEQLEEEVAAAIFGNVGTIISFRVGANDAEHLAKEFAPTFIEEDIINLAKYEVYMKLMIDGVASTPFSAMTMAPIAKRMDSREKVLSSSRERYAIKREVIEEKVNTWSGFTDGVVAGQKPVFAAPAPVVGAPAPLATMSAAPLPDGGMSTPQGAPFASSSERQYQAKCARCGKDLRLKFPPDPSRPFFCKECLPLAKAEGLTAPPPKPKPLPPPPALPKVAPATVSKPPPAASPRPAPPTRPREVKAPPAPAAVPGAVFGGKIRIVKEDVKEPLPTEAPKREEPKAVIIRKTEVPKPKPLPPPPSLPKPPLASRPSPAVNETIKPPTAPQPPALPVLPSLRPPTAPSGPTPLIPGKKITFE